MSLFLFTKMKHLRVNINRCTRSWSRTSRLTIRPVCTHDEWCPSLQKIQTRKNLGESVVILLPFSCAIISIQPRQSTYPGPRTALRRKKKKTNPRGYVLWERASIEDPRVGWRDAFTGLVNRVFCDAEALVLYIRMFTTALRLPLCPV